MEVKSGYRETEIGSIPDDWGFGPIGDKIDLLTGFPFSSSGYTDSGVRLLRGSNVKRGETDWSDDITNYWPSVTADISRYELQTGDLVIAMDGALVGRSYAVLKEEDLPALLLQRVARIRSSEIEVDFLAQFFAAQWFAEYSDTVKTHTAIPHTSADDIRNFKIPLPPRPEQRAVADALSDVDALIEKLEALIAKKRAIKTATMQRLLTGEQRLPGFDEAWTTKRLGEVAPLQRGFDLPTSDVKPGPFPVVYSNGVLRKHATAMDTGPGVVTGRSGTLGKVHYVEESYWPHNTSLWVTDFCSNHPKFVYYLYSFIGLQRFGGGSGVPTLNRNVVHEHEVSLPAADEQKAIANILTDMDAEIDALRSRREKTQAIKQGMMQELLTGKTRLV